jgi:phage FluMu gp28-like protein
LEKEEFLNRFLTDLNYTASTSEQLVNRPKALKEVISDKRVRQRLLEDPVFFAVLMCSDQWLVNAPEHQRLLRDTHPRQVAVCGRGWGKSLVFSRKNLWLIYTQPKVESLIISSTQRQSMIMFDYCYHTIQANPLMREMIKHPGTTRTTIRLKQPLGGRLTALPCSPDKLRGFHPDWVFIDEASIVPTEMITSEIMLMLTKPDSHLVICGTPKSFDHILHKAYLDTRRYSVHHYPSHTSPLVNTETLNEWKQDMTQEEWQREVEAEWTELANAFYPMDLIINCLDPTLGNLDTPNHYHEDLETIQKTDLHGTYHAGLDIGKQVDHTVLAVIQKIDDKRRLVYKHQFPLDTPYPDIIGHTARADQIFNFANILVDKTGVGDAIIDEMQLTGLHRAEGLFLTDRWKEEILTHLKLLMEQQKLAVIPDDKELIAQMNEQQHEYQQPKTAREHIHQRFWHPPRRHDDQLFALALACYASKQEQPKLTVVYR